MSNESIVILDYGAGNVKSVLFALERLGARAIVSNSKEVIQNASKVIFPGVGEASSAMKQLKEHGLDILIPTLQQPVLGICLGMQLMCTNSEEGDTVGLGVFDVTVKKFISDSLKIPHMGWNQIYEMDSDLFLNIHQNDYAYFVHSYYVPLMKNTIAVTNYGQSFSAALQKDNFYGVQFHPEKSSALGLRVLQNFLNK